MRFSIEENGSHSVSGSKYTSLACLLLGILRMGILRMLGKMQAYSKIRERLEIHELASKKQMLAKCMIDRFLISGVRV